MGDTEEIGKTDVINFLKIMAPMGPFVTEELYYRLRGGSDNPDSIHLQSWPVYKQKELEEKEVTMVVQVNGKVRGKIMLSRSAKEQEAEKAALEIENVRKYVPERYTLIFVPGKIINFIVK